MAATTDESIREKLPLFHEFTEGISGAERRKVRRWSD
jgi:hypothetical protein